MIYTINCNNWPYSFQEKCKIVHSRQRAVGHLSYSGTLKFWKRRNTLLYKHMTVWLMVVWWYCVLPELKLCVLCIVFFFSFLFQSVTVTKGLFALCFRNCFNKDFFSFLRFRTPICLYITVFALVYLYYDINQHPLKCKQINDYALKTWQVSVLLE